MPTLKEQDRHEENTIFHGKENFPFDAVMNPFWSLQDEDSQRRRLQVMNECSDATGFFSSRTTNGVDILATFYDCQCSGDLSSNFTFACTMKDNEYCYDLDKSGTSQCLHHNATYEFSVASSTNTIYRLESGVHCYDYTKNGPKGRLCHNDSRVCSYLLKDDHEYTTLQALDTCIDYQLCSSELTKLGYSSEIVEKLCPYMKLGGVECNTYGYDTCNSVNNEVFYRGMPDCSNVESCATDSCQKYPRIDPTPERNALKFPQCVASSSTTYGAMAVNIQQGGNTILLTLTLILSFLW